MKHKESLEVLTQMARMHDILGERLNIAINNKQYVEVSWLCYAIFEQRIMRIMQKHVTKCPKGKRSKEEKPISISTKILCLKKLCKQKYGIYSDFDKELLDKIDNWCKQRNILIHGLVSLEHYKKYDEEFKRLAESGVPLVNQIYVEATRVRDWCNSGKRFGKFPEMKCRCKHRCVCEVD